MTELGDLQRQMEATFGTRDRARGIPATVAWLAEEVGELAKAVARAAATNNFTNSATRSPGLHPWPTSSVFRSTTRSLDTRPVVLDAPPHRCVCEE